MARTTPTHWVGVLFLFIAAILLLITTISAPVIKDIAILKVMLTNKTDIRNSSVTFGTFGHCILDVPPNETDQDLCFPKHIGYQPASIMAKIDGTQFSKTAANTADGLTHVMVLHPIACGANKAVDRVEAIHMLTRTGIAFIAFLLSLGAGVVGSVLGAAVAGLAFILTLVAVILDFILFGIIKDHVNSDKSGSHAYFTTGMWTALTALILLFLGMFIVLFTCFSARKAKKNATYKTTSDTYNGGYDTTNAAVGPRRKRFGIL